MKKKAKVLEALILSSLLTMPSLASADNTWLCKVMVDGNEKMATDDGGPLIAGQDGSTVTIEKFVTNGKDKVNDTYSALFQGQFRDLEVRGKTITSNGILAANGSAVTVGNSATDAISITGSGDSEGRYGILSLHSTGKEWPQASHVMVEGKTINISTESKIGAALWAQNGTQKVTAPKDAASITVKGETVNLTSPDAAIVNYSNGQITLTGDTTINAPTALDVRGYSTTNINTDGAHKTVVNGNIVFETPATPGNKHASGELINAYVNLNLTGKDSVWNGRAYADYDNKEHLTGDDFRGPVTGMHLTMKESATWNVNGNSLMSTLDADTSTVNLEAANAQLLADKATLTGGTVNLNGDDSRIKSDALTASGTTFNFNGKNAALLGKATLDGGMLNVNRNASAGALTLNDATVNLNGNGTRMNVESLAGSKAVVNTSSLENKLTVGSSSIPDLTVHGTSNIADAIQSNEGNAQKLADVVASNDHSVATRITTEEGLVAGSYDLAVEDGKVVLPKKATEEGPAKRPGEDGKVNPPKSTYTPNESNQGIDALATMNLISWRQENNDLNKRLGELRDSEGKEGVWARMVRGEAKYGLRNMKNQYNYYQVGYDTKVGNNWTVGAAYSKTDGTTSFSRGTSDNNHDGVAIYGSYLADNGSFVDLIAKYSHLDTDYHVVGGAGDGDYDNNAFALSAEYGKRFHGHNGLWIEPQVELTYGTVDAADYTTKRGVKVHHDSMDSLVGRLGFAVGKDIKAGHLYARASYLYDFDGDTSVTMTYNGSKTRFKDDIGGGWWEVGVGANLNLSKATHMYIDVEKTYGGDVVTPWQWGIGFRYSF